MTAPDARQERAQKLQERILGHEPPLPAEPEQLVADIRNALRAASDEGVLTTKPHEVFSLLKSERDGSGKVLVAGGYKDFKRTGTHPRFVRADGAWFHFTLTVAPRAGKPLIMVAYDFEIVFGAGARPAFVRFDLNPKDHHNEAEGLRSHVHPGTDDFSAPSPFMSPLELLDVLVHELRFKRPAPRS